MSTKFDYVPSADTHRSGQSTLAGMFRASAQSHAILDAIVEGDKALTYAEVDDQSGRLAQLLIDEGLEFGDRVGILARNCTEYLLLELAAAK